MTFRAATALGLAVLAGCASPAPTGDFTIRRDGAPELFGRTVGDGPDTVIVVHGGGLHHGYLREPLASLVPGRTLVFYDQRGRGRSAPVADSAALTFDDELADLDAVRAHFQLERAAVIGHHWGGAVAALYAARHPGRVSRMLLVSPFPVIYSFVYELTAVAGDTARFQALLAEAGRPITPDSAVAVCRRSWPLFFSPLKPDLGTPYRALAPSLCDVPGDRLATSGFVTRNVQRSLGQWVFRPELNQVSVPTLVIEGSGEPLVEEAAIRWAQHLTDARVTLLPRPYLFPWIGDPAAFQRQVGRFMAGEWPAESVRPERWRPPSAAPAEGGR